MAAIDEAGDLIDGASDVAEELVGRRAIGVSHRLMGAVDTGLSVLSETVAIGERTRCTEETELARTSLAAALFSTGDAPAAFDALELAIQRLSGVALAEARFQRGTLRARSRQTEAGLADFAASLPVLRRAGSDRIAAVLLNNRGIVRIEAGDLRRAWSDLRAAERLYREAELPGGVGLALQNQAIVMSLQGDFVAALELVAQAIALLERAGRPTAAARLDHCDMLLMLGLADHAFDEARSALAELDRGRVGEEAAEGSLVCSGAALARGDVEAAEHYASEAIERFSSQGRPAWARSAHLARLRAASERGTLTRSQRRSLERLLVELVDAGPRHHAVRAELLHAETSIRLRRLSAAAAALERSASDDLSLDLRIDRVRLQALLAAARGDRPRAIDLVQAGLDLIDAHRSAIAATEARVAISRRMDSLARLGAGLLRDEPGRVADFVERCRAASLRAAPVRTDASVARSLGDLRTLSRQLALPEADADTDELMTRQADKVRQIRRQAYARLERSGARLDPVTVDDLVDLPPDDIVLQLRIDEGDVECVAVTGKDVAAVRIGSSDGISRTIRGLHVALRRLVRLGADPPSGLSHKTLDLVDQLATRLEPCLPASVRNVVLSPPSRMLGLPGLAVGRSASAVVIAPSLTRWWHADQHPRSDVAGRLVALAGPRLRQANRETAEVASCYEDVRRFTARQAKVEDVLAALDGCSIAHFACHGRFRADNPMFSALELADGPLMAYDLEQLDQAPDIVVLSSCDVGQVQDRPGDELLGMVSAFLTAGTRSVIASTVPVPDLAPTRRLMRGLHDGLSSGVRPAEALARAASRLGDTGLDLAVKSAFSCYGWG